MGIPYFFASLIRRNKHIVSQLRIHLQPAICALDFNAFIHTYLDDTRPVASIVEALQTFLDKTCQPTTLYIAMDGLVPYGKIVQQRYRRFKIGEPGVFDRNQISPGTPFMKELDQTIRARFPYAIMSSTEEPGEGEHKIFQWLKTRQETDVYIYGLDADLILLSLYHPHVKLLRENQTFGGKVGEGFSALSIQSLSSALPLPAAQYVALCVLCFGNDFMPCLGMFSLREGGHDRALKIYDVCGKPDLLTPAGRRTFLECAGKQEFPVYRKAMITRQKPTELSVVSADGAHLETRYNLHVLDGSTDTEFVVAAFWKTFHWTYLYFSQNVCPDWNWVYPLSEAPLVKQILRFPELAPAWKVSPSAFNITKQLQFILPKASLHRVGGKQVYPDEMYNEETDTRIPWMRSYTWESEPLISVPSAELTGVRSFQPLEENIPVPVV